MFDFVSSYDLAISLCLRNLTLILFDNSSLSLLIFYEAYKTKIPLANKGSIPAIM